MPSAEPQSDNNLMALLATIALGYFSTRYRLLRPLRQGLPIFLLMCLWFMGRSNRPEALVKPGVD